MPIRTLFPALLAVAVFTCSSFALELKEVSFATKEAGSVIFSHTRHMKQKGIAGNCKSCHNEIFAMNRRVPSTMKQMEQGKSCGACHDGKRGFPLSACVRCHKVKDVTIKVAATGPVRFSHARHTAKYRDCSSCHSRLFKAGRNKPVGMAAMEKGKSCGACHNGTVAFALKRCTGCHPNKKELPFAIKETGPLTFSHQGHQAKNGCGACHTKLYAPGPNPRVTMKQMEQGKSCGACHNGSMAFSVSACGSCHAVQDKVYRVKQTGPLTFRHAQHLESVSCSKCHTKLYPLGAKKRPAVTMAQMENGKSCGACHNGKMAFGLANCSSCHPVKTVTFPVKPVAAKFSHVAHLTRYDCSACHEKLFPAGHGQRYSMGDMEKGKSCGACHDAKLAFTVSENCIKCHDI